MIRAYACGRYRDALAGIAERGERTAAGRAALDHVGDCRACADTLAELMLTAYALRRMAIDAAIGTAGPGDDAWTRLRARIERSRRRARAQAWQWRATVGGLATASMLVALLVGPAAVHMTDHTYGEVEPVSFLLLTDRAETQLEQARINTARRSAAPSSTHRVDAVTRPASVSGWHPVEDEGGAFRTTQTEGPRRLSAGIRPI